MPEPSTEIEGGSEANKRVPEEAAPAQEDEARLDSTITVRVPSDVLAAYRRLPRRRKALVRDAVRAFLAEVVRAAGRLPSGAVATVENIVMNVNMPVAMVRAEDTGSVELLRERIRELEFELREVRKHLESYREKLERAARERAALEARASEAERRARDLEDRLRRAEAARRRMEEAARAWARGELTAEEAMRRIANELYVPELIARRLPPSP